MENERRIEGKGIEGNFRNKVFKNYFKNKVYADYISKFYEISAPANKTNYILIGSYVNINTFVKKLTTTHLCTQVSGML